MTKYVFPARFLPEAVGYSVTFPDIPGAITQGDDMNDALAMAADALGLMLAGMVERGEKIPEPTPYGGVSSENGELIMFIECEL